MTERVLYLQERAPRPSVFHCQCVVEKNLGKALQRNEKDSLARGRNTTTLFVE